LVAAIESFVSSVRQEAVLDRVLATVLFTEIVGSTTRSAELGDTRWNELLQRHHRVYPYAIGGWLTVSTPKSLLAVRKSW
jgi:class 3 adenylate cyclase